MLSRGDKGPAITELQQRLLALGYPLPRWGADGDLGNETLKAVTLFLADHAAGHVDDDPEVVDDGELALVQQVYAATGQAIQLPGLNFFDLRKESDRRNIIGRRAWQEILGITLHQCAVDFGHEKPERWDTLAAHVGISLEGNVNWVHDFEHIVPHGNELNKPTVGIEFEGAFPGIVALRGPGRMQSPTPAQVKAGHEAIPWIVAVCAAHGSKLTRLNAHRQTAATRRGDPGEELWKLVALPMLGKLALSDGGPQFKIDNGRVIPEAWNPAYIGNPY
jgi:hypothetical protein